MKKNLFWAAFACVALASCVNESENLLEENKGQRLTFGAPVMYNQSRAVVGEIDGTDYPDKESFTVFGIEHEGKFTAWNANNVLNFFPTTGEVVTKSQTDNFWYTKTDYYVPTEPNRYLSFAAYSPSEAKDNGTISYGVDGLTITDWKMPNTNMYDLMYSTRSIDQKQAEIPIAFLHALSSIHIKFAMSEDNGPHSVKVTNVAIKGEGINNVGTFNDKITTEDDGTAAAWTNLAAANLPAKYEIFNGAFNVTTSAVEPESADFLPIPQKLVNQTLVISYEINMKDGEAPQVVTDLEIPFSKFKVDDAVVTTEWERAKRYFYTVTFGGLTKIKFSPSVKEGWDDVEEAGTYIIK